MAPSDDAAAPRIAFVRCGAGFDRSQAPLVFRASVRSRTRPSACASAAPCTAMVFVWSNLVDGEPHFTLSQVALNNSIIVFAFAPIVALLLGLSSITVPWNTLILSVVLYIVVPVIVAQLWRQSLLIKGGQAALARTLRALGAFVPVGAAADARAAIRPARRTDHAAAARDRAARGPDLDTGLFQRGAGLLAEPAARRRVVRGRTFGADRGQQFFRAGRGDGNRSVRLPVAARRSQRSSASWSKCRLCCPSLHRRRSRGWYERGSSTTAAPR